MEEVKGLTLPPAIVKLLSLEFRNIAADLLFIRASQFYGGKVETIDSSTKEDWQWLYRNIDLVTELDPYFQDPYYMGNAFLSWDAGMVKEANSLLKKATYARDWDWMFPFYLGFNNFYFLGDNKTGAEYLRIASQRPGAWDFLTTLAARLYYMEGKTEAARAFMEKMWENENDPKRKQFYLARLDVLNKIFFLEKAVDVYESRIGLPPGELKALVKAKIIREIPRDPYGGSFYIDRDGSIKTTSNLASKHSR
ncbi:MAG: hypothetical protein RQ824_07675 [bacterium]|nr:hypothetical protein [bacterium]